MLAGGLILSKWGGFKDRVYSVFVAYIGTGIILALSGLLNENQFIMFLILSAFMGVTIPFFNGPATALLQSKIEPQYLGRVFSLFGSLMSLAAPLGLALSGLFADEVGINRWFFISGILILLIGALNLLIPSIRNLDK